MSLLYRLKKLSKNMSSKFQKPIRHLFKARAALVAERRVCMVSNIKQEQILDIGSCYTTDRNVIFTLKTLNCFLHPFHFYVFFSFLWTRLKKKSVNQSYHLTLFIWRSHSHPTKVLSCFLCVYVIAN